MSSLQEISTFSPEDARSIPLAQIHSNAPHPHQQVPSFAPSAHPSSGSVPFAVSLVVAGVGKVESGNEKSSELERSLSPLWCERQQDEDDPQFGDQTRRKKKLSESTAAPAGIQAFMDSVLPVNVLKQTDLSLARVSSGLNRRGLFRALYFGALLSRASREVEICEALNHLKSIIIYDVTKEGSTL